jgi:hypothetical protein
VIAAQSNTQARKRRLTGSGLANLFSLMVAVPILWNRTPHGLKERLTIFIVSGPFDVSVGFRNSLTVGRDFPR